MASKIHIDPGTPFFYMKKHFCPRCGGKLSRYTDYEIIRPHSPAAKDPKWAPWLDKQASLHGDRGSLKCCWSVFECPECGAEYTAQELIDAEGGERKWVQVLAFCLFIALSLYASAFITWLVERK